MSFTTLACFGSLMLLLCTPWCLELVQGHQRFIDQLDNVMIATPDALKDLIDSSSLSLIFFCRRETPSINSFLATYNTSGEFLKQYGVQLAVFDCMDEKKTETACSRDGIDVSIFTYRNGIALMSLEIEYLFDVDSIVANALQLVLLHDVPIIESRLERHELEQSLVGKRDLLLIHPQAVGTAEHRIFLEVAHAYKDRFSFALNIDYRAVHDLQDSEELATAPTSAYGLWVLFCSETNKDDVMSDGYCPHIMYKGQLTLFNLAHFVQKLQEKSVFHAPRDGVMSLLHMTADDDPVVYAFINCKPEEKNEDVLNILKYDLRGSAKVIIVDMNDLSCRIAAKDFEVICQPNAGPLLGVKAKLNIMQLMKPEDWSVSGVKSFLLPHVFPEWRKGKYSSADDASSVESTKTYRNDMQFLIDEVEAQDDQVATAVFGMKQKEMAGLELVPGLLKDSFYRTIRKSPLLIVLFYEPFDHISMAFLRDFGIAAQILASNYSTANVLARVNCFDGTDLCSAENITTYPTTRIYRQNPASHETYMEPLDALAVSKTAKLLQMNSPAQLTMEEEVDKFSMGQHPTDFSKFTPSSVMLLATDSTSELVTVFKNVSALMSQVTALAVVHPSLAPQIAQKYETTMPSLVAHNREDKVKPVRTLALDKGDTTASAMTAFIRAATIHFVPELGPENFPHLYSRHQPMAILFVDDRHGELKEAALASFSALAVSDRFPASVFCWIDAQYKSMGVKILSEFTWTAQLPMVSVVKHRQGQVFNFHPMPQESQDPIESEKLASWLDNVLSGKATPSKILEQGIWGPPGPHYNFLELQQKGPKRGVYNPLLRNHGDGAQGGVTFDDSDTYFDDSALDISQEEQDLMENEVRQMLLQRHKQLNSEQEPQQEQEDVPQEDFHIDLDHSEL